MATLRGNARARALLWRGMTPEKGTHVASTDGKMDWDDIVGSSSSGSASSPLPSRSQVRRRGSRSASETAGGKKKGKWGKRIGLGFLFAFLAVLIAGTGTVLVMYARADVPAPDQFALAQTTKVYYNDGVTEMGSLSSDVNRTIIDSSTLPDHVSKAVVASEDRTFYTNSGIDLRGILRALVNNVTTGSRQGGSTLTQQYVERYYMGETTSYFGKLEEAVLAVKINREQSKDEILGNYLNTIYFGRGAYGIEAASQAYFGHPASELTLSESAMIAGIIPAPSAWDPAVDPDQAEARWERVLGLMVEDGWISAEEKAVQTFPATIDPASLTSADFAGPTGYLLQQVRAELTATGAFTEEQIDTGGLKIISTIDKAKQDAAVAAAESMKAVEGWDSSSMHTALTSIDPATGEIVAEYAGEDYQVRQQNGATQDISAAGSTFKLFALLANARAGGSIEDVYNGNSPRTFAGVDGAIQNDSNYSWGQVTLTKAMGNSVNTAFVALNEKIGADATMQAAIDAGIPEDTIGLEATLLNVLGFAAPHNVDLATAYAVAANGGHRVEAHIVREVLSSTGDRVYATTVAPEQVFTNEEVSSILPALQAVTDSGGTAEKVAAANLGFASGGKTGTSQEQKSALFVGFVPEVVTAVTQYQLDAEGSPVPLNNIGGLSEFHGGDWPTDVWLNYMQQILGTLSVTEFSWYVPVTPTKTVEESAQSARTTEPQEQTEPTESTTPTTPTTPSESTVEGEDSGTDNGSDGSGDQVQPEVPDANQSGG